MTLLTRRLHSRRSSPMLRVKTLEIRDVVRWNRMQAIISDTRDSKKATHSTSWETNLWWLLIALCTRPIISKGIVWVHLTFGLTITRFSWAKLRNERYIVEDVWYMDKDIRRSSSTLRQNKPTKTLHDELKNNFTHTPDTCNKRD